MKYYQKILRQALDEGYTFQLIDEGGHSTGGYNYDATIQAIESVEVMRVVFLRDRMEAGWMLVLPFESEDGQIANLSVNLTDWLKHAERETNAI